MHLRWKQRWGNGCYMTANVRQSAQSVRRIERKKLPKNSPQSLIIIVVIDLMHRIEKCSNKRRQWIGNGLMYYMHIKYTMLTQNKIKPTAELLKVSRTHANISANLPKSYTFDAKLWLRACQTEYCAGFLYQIGERNKREWMKREWQIDREGEREREREWYIVAYRTMRFY